MLFLFTLPLKLPFFFPGTLNSYNFGWTWKLDFKYKLSLKFYATFAFASLRNWGFLTEMRIQTFFYIGLALCSIRRKLKKKENKISFFFCSFWSYFFRYIILPSSYLSNSSDWSSNAHCNRWRFTLLYVIDIAFRKNNTIFL